MIFSFFPQQVIYSDIVIEYDLDLDAVVNAMKQYDVKTAKDLMGAAQPYDCIKLVSKTCDSGELFHKIKWLIGVVSRDDVEDTTIRKALTHRALRNLNKGNSEKAERYMQNTTLYNWLCATEEVLWDF